MAGGLTATTPAVGPTTSVHACAAVHAERRGDGTRVDVLRSAPPLTVRATADGVYLVGSGAGPLGGDHLRLDVAVGEGAALTIRSAAATTVLPGTAGTAPSTATVDADVGPSAALRWLPEPTIAAAGCDHRASASVRLGAGATLVWRDVVVLGRHGEGPGSLLQRLRVDRCGAPLLRADLALGPRWPGWDGPAGVGPARAVATVVLVGPAAVEAPPVVESGVRAAVAVLDAGAVVLTAVGATPGAVVRVVDAWLASTGDACRR